MESKVLAVIFFYLSISLIGCSSTIKMPPDSEEFYRVKNPDQRVKDQISYFKDEYRQIANKRRQKSIDSDSDIMPANLVGLGLSGGGIRSAAYQLGLLAGLRSSKIGGPKSSQVSALDKVDYLSCVSGGCWATGAFLIAKEPVDIFFACLNEQALNGKVEDLGQCSRAKDILRNKQIIELTKKEKKEDWEEEIQTAYFPEECHKFEFGDRESKCWNNFEGKPNVIFNITHSTDSPKRFAANIDNLPFQITPDQVGTIVDCGSHGLLADHECGLLKGNLAGNNKIGFFVRQDAKDFKWVRREASGKSLWLKATSSPGSQMSKAMSHASAVIGSPVGLAFSMGLTYQGNEPEDEIRNNYFLTDGGFTENLGLLSLIERGVELVVLSDMGYPEREGDDLQMAVDQVKKLLKCDVTGFENLNRQNIITTLKYSCQNVREDKGNGKGTILYVRPYPDNIENFKSQLKLERTELYACIEEKSHRCYGDSPLKKVDENSLLESKHQFPQTETMLTRYDDRLIRTYYLLGKFIGEQYIAPELLK